jgi:hypothetical protein
VPIKRNQTDIQLKGHSTVSWCDWDQDGDLDLHAVNRWGRNTVQLLQVAWNPLQETYLGFTIRRAISFLLFNAVVSFWLPVFEPVTVIGSKKREQSGSPCLFLD